MIYEDNLRDRLTDLLLLVHDLKRQGEGARDAIAGLEERIDMLEKKLSHKGGRA